jgi:hypothetical protein
MQRPTEASSLEPVKFLPAADNKDYYNLMAAFAKSKFLRTFLWPLFPWISSIIMKTGCQNSAMVEYYSWSLYNFRVKLDLRKPIINDGGYMWNDNSFQRIAWILFSSSRSCDGICSCMHGNLYMNWDSWSSPESICSVKLHFQHWTTDLQALTLQSPRPQLLQSELLYHDHVWTDFNRRFAYIELWAYTAINITAMPMSVHRPFTIKLNL